MSQEKPCLCFEVDLGDGTRRVIHGPPCRHTNCPKAEATPANVSEPPIDFFDAIRVWTPLDPKHSVLKGHAMSAHLALKAQNAAQEAELAYLKQGIPLSYNPNAMCRNGHEMVLFKSVDEHCPMCAITAEVERLNALIAEAEADSPNLFIDLAHARAVKARRAAEAKGEPKK